MILPAISKKFDGKYNFNDYFKLPMTYVGPDKQAIE